MKQRVHLMIVLTCAIILAGVTVKAPVNAALWNKHYIVKHDQGKRILCDPYVVQKNDWIFKIFRQKGEISEQDFPAFLEIFKRLNPDIDYINRVFPGNRILIPLKTITKDTLPIPLMETITIPFASISNRKDETVIIRKGDSVYKLLSQRFGDTRSKAYREGLARFKVLNPKITDLNLFVVGQKVQLPSILQGRPQSTIVLSESVLPQTALSPQITIADKTPAPRKIPKKPPAITATSLKPVATLLEAELYDQGRYHFPSIQGEDQYLDLNLFPVLRLKDKTRILFIRPFAKMTSDLDVIKSHWKNLRIVRIPAPPVSAYQLIDKIFLALNQNHRPPGKTAFADGEMQVKIKPKWSHKIAQPSERHSKSICLTPVGKTAKPFPEVIFKYLARHQVTYWEIRPDGQLTGTSSKDQPFQATGDIQSITAIDPRHFVRQISSVLGWLFQDKVTISFPYAGVQVDSVSSMVSTGSNRSCLVDFGNFAGDSISAIKSSGLSVVSTMNNFIPGTFCIAS